MYWSFQGVAVLFEAIAIHLDRMVAGPAKTTRQKMALLTSARLVAAVGAAVDEPRRPF
jgi:hypothetical protein